MEDTLRFWCLTWPGEGNVSARFNHSGSVIAGLCLLIILIGTACNDDDPARPFISASPDGLGRIGTAADVGGAWEFSLGAGADSCGIEFFPVTPDGVFQVTQAGTGTAFGVINECGTDVAQGTGTSNSSRVVTFSYEETYQAAANCILTLRMEAIGTIDVSSGVITGSYTTDVEPRDDFQDCSVTFPCALSGPFAATSCPPATCTFSVCGI